MTGLIYVAIIAVWAVVLVPGWLHRHDRRQLGYRNPRVLAFMSRMAARTSVLGIPLPGRAEQAGPDVDGPDVDGGVVGAGAKPARERPPRRRRRARGRRTRGAGRSAAARRRLVLALLLLIGIGVGVAVAAGLLPPAALAAPVVLILGFLVLAHYQVRRPRRGRGRASRRAGARSSDASGPEAAPAAPTAAPGTWEPRSTPLPGYVTAAQEQAPAANVWTAAAMLERAQQQERARQVRAQQERLRAERQRSDRTASSQARAGLDRRVLGDDDRDEEFLRRQAAGWRPADSAPFRRASNE